MMEYGDWTNAGAAFLMLLASGFFHHRLLSLPSSQPQPSQRTLMASALWIGVWASWAALYAVRHLNAYPHQGHADRILSNANSAIMFVMAYVLGRRTWPSSGVSHHVYFGTLLLALVLVLDLLLLLVGDLMLSASTGTSFVRHFSGALAFSAPIAVGIAFLRYYGAKSLCILFVAYAIAQPLMYGSFSVPQDGAHQSLYAEISKSNTLHLPAVLRKATTVIAPRPGAEQRRTSPVIRDADDRGTGTQPVEASWLRASDEDMQVLEQMVRYSAQLLVFLSQRLHPSESDKLWEAAVSASSIKQDLLPPGHSIIVVSPQGLNRDARFKLLDAVERTNYWHVWMQLNGRGVFLALLSVLKVILCAGALQQLQRVPPSDGERTLLPSSKQHWVCHFPGNSHKAWYWSLVALAGLDFLVLLYLYRCDLPVLALAGTAASIITLVLALRNRTPSGNPPVDPEVPEVGL